MTYVNILYMKNCCQIKNFNYKIMHYTETIKISCNYSCNLHDK